MSNTAATETSPETANGVVETETEAVTVEMTRKDFEQWEREVQLGIRDTLPDGRKIKDVQDDLAKTQIEQEKNRRMPSTSETDASPDNSAGTLNEIKADETVEVTIHATGAMSISPIPEKTETAVPPVPTGDDSDGDEDEPQEPENDLPDALPGRKQLLASGIVSLEFVAKMTLEDLKEVDGIGGKTADAILSYGKS